MKIIFTLQSHAHQYWSVVRAILCTANMSFSAIICALRKKITKQWVDARLQRWVKDLCRIIRVTCIIENPHHVQPQPGVPTIVMCNHSSLLDIPFSFQVFPKYSMRMLAKKELIHVPLMGRAMQAAGFPFIDRKNKIQAIKDLEELKHIMNDGVLLWVAPEGTRAKDGRLGPFKKGVFMTAIESGATIIPIAIRGAYGILPTKSIRIKLNQKVYISVGEAINAQHYSLQNKDELIKKTRAVMEKLLSVDILELSS